MRRRYGALVNAPMPAPEADRMHSLAGSAQRGGRLEAAAAGIVATAAALATGELLAGLLPGLASPLASVSQVVVDLQPPGAKELVVDLFGLADKLALQVGIVIVALLIGALVGLIARTRLTLGMGIIGGFVALGFLAGLQDRLASPLLGAGGALAQVAVGTWSLDRLMGLAGNRAAPNGAAMPDWDRRRLLIRGGGLAVASLVAGTAGRLLVEGRAVPATGDGPVAQDPAGLPDGASLGVEGVTPIVIPNDDFYRIDTAIVVPIIDRDSWRLRVHGMVDREITLSYADLMQLPVIDQYVTIACVSNRVGGGLVGNAKWTGVRLRDVLDMAGVQAGATQLVGRSADGWTAGSPTAWVMDPEREPMIALGMNGAPLPPEHGYPARVIIPGLFGYVSATKWVTELELTTLEAFDAYWVPLGWAKEAPILTQSRIDRPSYNQPLDAGTYTFGGVAWAPDRGVRKVEVQVDDQEWRTARISTPISDATWVQWAIDWDVAPGEHKVRVRATDGTGETQTDRVTRPDPDGARGWHTVPFRVA